MPGRERFSAASSLLDFRGSADWVSTAPVVLLRILGGVVERFGVLAEVPSAVTVSGFERPSE